MAIVNICQLDKRLRAQFIKDYSAIGIHDYIVFMFRMVFRSFRS